MLTAQIIALIIFVFLPILLCILKKFCKAPNYEICVMGGANDIFSSIFLDFIGIVFTIFSIFARDSLSASIILYGFGMFGGISAAMGFFHILFNYTAYDCNKIILKRFFVTKEIPLVQIKRISCFKNNIHFYTLSKNNKYKTLFSIDAKCKNAAEFVHIVDKS